MTKSLCVDNNLRKLDHEEGVVIDRAHHTSRRLLYRRANLGW